MLAGDDSHHVSIGIVPYNAQVNLGPTLRGKFNATNVHGVANVDCLELPDEVFATTEMSQTLPNCRWSPRPISSTSTNKIDGFVAPTSTSYAVPNYSGSYCRDEVENIVRLPNNDATVLKSQINGLTANGNTSIVLGLKWGEALLDP